MNQKKIQPDDPRLTAYALGELDAQESAELARAIAGNPEAEAVIDEVRVLAGRLEEVLANEPIERLTAADSDSDTHVGADLGEEKKVVHFPYLWMAGLAAACFAVLLALRPTTGTRSQGAPTGAVLAEAQPAASAPAVPERLGPDDTPALASSGSRTEVAEAAAPAAPARALDPTSADRAAPSNEARSVALVGAAAPGALALTTARGAADRRNAQLSPLASYGTSRPAESSRRALEAYAYQPAQGFLGVAGYPLSAFSANVGTENYANIRRFLRNGRLPPPDSIRIEELLNYFSYGSIAPRDANPLSASLEVAAAPWNPSHRLVRIGVKGRDVSELERVSDSRPLLEESLGNGLVAVAKDVKLQVEFNPEQAKSYRLIGYEDNAVRKTDAKGARLAGAEMPAGHMITALYEVVPVGVPDAPSAEGDPLRYSSNEMHLAANDDPKQRELLTLKIHYKLPVVEVSRKMEIPLVDTGADFAVASKDFKFAAAVAGFGMLLSESPHKGDATYDKVLTWAQEGQDKEDKSGKRREFIDLVKQAKDAPVE